MTGILDTASMIYKTFRHVETLFIEGRNLQVPNRPAIGYTRFIYFPLTISRPGRYRFLPRTNKVCTCRKALFDMYLLSTSDTAPTHYHLIAIFHASPPSPPHSPMQEGLARRPRHRSPPPPPCYRGKQNAYWGVEISILF